MQTTSSILCPVPACPTTINRTQTGLPTQILSPLHMAQMGFNPPFTTTCMVKLVRLAHLISQWCQMTERYPFQLKMSITCISRRDGPIIFPITLHAPSSYASFPSHHGALYVLPSNLPLTMLLICPYYLIIASLSFLYLTSTLIYVLLLL